jgi:hypothetical protein
MTQALYAHMNNKTIKKNHLGRLCFYLIVLKSSPEISFIGLPLAPIKFDFYKWPKVIWVEFVDLNDHIK